MRVPLVLTRYESVNGVLVQVPTAQEEEAARRRKREAWLAAEEARRDLERRWYLFCRGWRLVGLAANGRTHLVRSRGYDETDAWCDGASYHDSEMYDDVGLVSCPACLRAAADAGRAADAQLRRLR